MSAYIANTIVSSPVVRFGFGQRLDCRNPIISMATRTLGSEDAGHCPGAMFGVRNRRGPLLKRACGIGFGDHYGKRSFHRAILDDGTSATIWSGISFLSGLWQLMTVLSWVGLQLLDRVGSFRIRTILTLLACGGVCMKT